ncbi:MAG: HAMP domain-containing histidine kinase [Nitrospira sp.]|nr:HAMP domain-containing histidine kinase [Nitrospira sp.]
MKTQSEKPAAATNRLPAADRLEGMPSQSLPKVAIIGAGRGGTVLLDLLHQLHTVELAGITDTNRSAPGFQLAHELHIPVFDEVSALMGIRGLNLIIDLTDDPAIADAVRRHLPAKADVLSGPAARLLCDLVRQESTLRAELLQTDKLAEIGSFAAGIAHDMNNPLQLILGLAENLTEERDIEAVQLQAREIIDAVKRTSAICRDLTTYSRRAAPHSHAVVPINAKLDEALKIARYAVGFQDIEVRKAYWPDARVTGSPDELLHVFINLITNAVHAMDQGGILTLTTATIESTTTVRVSDTGRGIPQEMLGRIFEPFFTTKPPGKGTGLGLYNIKNVIHRMHGTITVESLLDHGSTFTITFPDPSGANAGSAPS